VKVGHTYGPKVMRITNNVLLSFGVNYNLCVYDMGKKTPLMHIHTSGELSKEGYVTMVLSENGFICLSEGGGALYIWDLGWPKNELEFQSKLRACTAFDDITFKI
jgi:hypothetical protein